MILYRLLSTKKCKYIQTDYYISMVIRLQHVSFMWVQLTAPKNEKNVNLKICAPHSFQSKIFSVFFFIFQLNSFSSLYLYSGDQVNSFLLDTFLRSLFFAHCLASSPLLDFLLYAICILYLGFSFFPLPQLHLGRTSQNLTVTVLWMSSQKRN